MKSRITIEVDFDNGNEPVIQILSRNSDDIRDRLIKSFYQKLHGISWCKIKFVQDIPDETSPTPSGGFIEGLQGFKRIFITPISESQLKEQAEIMLEQYKIIEQYNNTVYTN